MNAERLRPPPDTYWPDVAQMLMEAMMQAYHNAVESGDQDSAQELADWFSRIPPWMRAMVMDLDPDDPDTFGEDDVMNPHHISTAGVESEEM